MTRTTTMLAIVAALLPSLASAGSTACLGGCRTPAPTTLVAPTTRDLGLVAPGGSSKEILCDVSSGGVFTCLCRGENSPDCDLLFDMCDQAGGLYDCTSDYGGDDDFCMCTY